jgi:hypothetical protein
MSLFSLSLNRGEEREECSSHTHPRLSCVQDQAVVGGGEEEEEEKEDQSHINVSAARFARGKASILPPRSRTHWGRLEFVVQSGVKTQHLSFSLPPRPPAAHPSSSHIIIIILLTKATYKQHLWACDDTPAAAAATTCCHLTHPSIRPSIPFCHQQAPACAGGRVVVQGHGGGLCLLS